ncbi:hypothetical protein [Wenyingzhuangia sp. IMCC45574]
METLFSQSLEKLNFDSTIDESDKTIVLKKYQNSLNEVFDEVFDSVCVSLLKGEYVCDDLLEAKIKKIHSDIDSKLQGLIQSDTLQIEDELLYSFHDDITYMRKAFKMLLEMYLSFIDVIQKGIKSNDQIEVVGTQTFYQFRSLEKRSGTFSLISKKIELFGLFLGLSLLDFFFNESLDQYKVLLNIERRIKRLTRYSEFCDNVLRKISFLKYKWEVKFKRDSTSTNGFVVYGQVINFDKVGKQNLFNNSKLNIWKKYIENHYEIDEKWKAGVRENTSALYDENLNELNVFQMHALLKFSKDTIRDNNKIKDIVEKSKELISRNQNEKYCFKKIYSYCLNNYLSSMVDVLDKDLFDSELYDGIKNLKREIDNNNNLCNNYNFFSDSKYLDYLLRRISRYLDFNEEQKNIYKDVIEVDINEVDDIIKNSNEKLIWSKKYFNYVFSLPYEECLVETPSKKLKHMYYASSFVLPAPSNKTHLDFEILLSDANNVINSFMIFSRFRREVSAFDRSKSELKEDIKDLESEMKTNKIDSIAIIGVFTAVIAFVMSSIQSFSFIKNLKDSLLFIFSVGSTLVIFLSLFTAIIKAKEKFRREWIYIPVFVSLIIMQAIILYCKSK